VKPSRPGPSQPLWREEVSFRAADERYVNRRQFAKFTVLASLGMFAGNVWILVKSLLRDEPSYPEQVVAAIDEIPVGAVKQFSYPGPSDPCLLIRLDPDTYVAYNQKCTHLSCAVVYDRQRDRIECPCHNGVFSARTGEVLQGPPPRPLVQIRLVRREEELVAVGLDTGSPS
jgi:Rieske Fe-S protein